MFGIKRLTKSRDEYKSLAYTLESELGEVKTSREETERELEHWKREVDYLQRELDHTREKFHLAMRALQGERERDNIMKHILEIDALKIKPLFVTPSADGKIAPNPEAPPHG